MKTLITVILVYIQVIMCTGFSSSFNGVLNAQNPETVGEILEIIARFTQNNNIAQNVQDSLHNFQANGNIQNANYNVFPNSQANAMQMQGMSFYNPQTNQAYIDYVQIREKTNMLNQLKNLVNGITTLMMPNPAVTTPEQEELKELIRQTDQCCQKITIQLAEQSLTQMQQMMSPHLAEELMHAQQPALFRETNMLPAMNALPRAPILPQPVARPVQNTSVIQAPLNNTINISAGRTVRTISSIDPSQASSSRVLGINVPLVQQNPTFVRANVPSATHADPARTSNRYVQIRNIMSEPFLRYWKARTLNDQYRDAYRERHKTVLCLPDTAREKSANLDQTQQPVAEMPAEAIIQTLKKRIDVCKPGQNIWYVMLNLLLLSKGNKYTEFNIIHENREVFNAKLNQFVGYYDGFFKDSISYMNKYGPVLYTKENNTKILNRHMRKNTIFEMYIKKSLDVPKMEECINKSSADFKTFPLLNRIRTVLSMPEVYEDLSSIPYVLFQRIVASMEESKKITRHIEIVKSLYQVAHHTENKLLKHVGIPFSETLLECFPNIANDRYQNENSSYALDKIYLQAYEAMVLFYKHAPYCYHNDAGILQRVKGKDVVVKQEYKKCEALIDIAHNENGQIRSKLKSQKSSTVTDSCDASFEHPNHYHVQFVDNCYQAVRRVCVPFLSTNERAYYVHTIEDIMKYLKDLYDIEEEGCIYALKTRIMPKYPLHCSWSFISEGDKKKTIDDLSKEEYHVLFYYIEKGTLDNFTLSIFKRPHYDSQREITMYTFKLMPEIPLFLSRFMQCAMQLGPFEKIGQHSTLTEKDLQQLSIQPSVYRYSQPINTAPEKSFTQVENYYSAFYLDRDIFKTYDFCHTLKDSAIQESATSHKLIWHIRTSKNSEEYTHYVFLDEQGDYKTKTKRNLSDIVNNAMKRNNGKGRLAYIFYGSEYIQTRKNTVVLDNNLKKIVNIAPGYGSQLKHSNFYKLIVVKPIDSSKSSLGIHNEILRILVHPVYNSRIEGHMGRLATPI